MFLLSRSPTHTTNSLLSLLLILFSHSFSLSNMELITDLDLMHSFAYIILSFSISITHSVHSTHSLFALTVHLLPFSHTPLLLRCHSSSLLLSHSSNSPSVSFTHSYTYILSFVFSSTLSLSLHFLFPYSLFHTLLYIYVGTIIFSYSRTPLSLDTLCLFQTLIHSLFALFVPLLPFSCTPLLLRCHSSSLLLSHTPSFRHSFIHSFAHKILSFSISITHSFLFTNYNEQGTMSVLFSL